jgi:hypothetical protein
MTNSNLVAIARTALEFIRAEVKRGKLPDPETLHDELVLVPRSRKRSLEGPSMPPYKGKTIMK